ncbi:MAG TPA: cytochrome c biogenesis protein CcsA [Tepidisphaeraceae bacterium]|jgi:ABC-type uncharacterized transport system permease subunit|nr:cytochrome c biogenesis protein CcsA [Tepidisphaeraceae bacterium]
MPTIGQLGLLIAAIAFFVISAVISLSRLWRERPGARIAAKACGWTGVLFGLIVLVWHDATRGNWLPLGDNFDSLIWLALLLAIFAFYVQRTKPIGGLDWFITPIVILLLTAAAVFGRTKPHEYISTTWAWVHRVSAYGGAVAFFVAGAVGAMYLVVNQRLRKKKLQPAGPNMGSLERLEHFTFTAVTVGFALLTIGAITGFVQLVFQKQHTSTAKIVLASGVWLVYALFLHSPINPRFRGRKAAMLSVLGVVLMIGTLVAVQLMPAGGTR